MNILSRMVNIFDTEGTAMERSRDTVWLPQHYIAQSFEGRDQTANFKENTQLSVPHQIGFERSVPWFLSPTNLRDMLQYNRISASAGQKLSSDINLEVMKVAAEQGTLVISRSTAASGYDDVSECDTIMNEQGLDAYDRYLALSSRDYNGMASNLAERTLGNSKKSLNAYEKSYVGQVAGFDTYKLDYANRLVAATATGVTFNGANQFYVPLATAVGLSGSINVDNRHQTVNLTVGGNTLQKGDCFTIAGVNAVHHITKDDTGQLKTFRVIEGGGTGSIQISPPIISGQGGADSELQYKNVSATPANGAVVTLLNTVTTQVNPFWLRDTIKLMPGTYVVPSDAGVGILTGSTEQGVQLTMQKQYGIDNMVTKYRFDIRFGVVMSNPEMSGILLFNQT